MNLGYIYIVIATILFSSLEIVLKSTANSFNPIQITLSRFLVGGLFLLPFAIKHIKNKELKLKKSDFKSFALLGFICVVVSMVFYQLAVISTKASVVAVIFSCNPIFIMLFAYAILKEKIYAYNVISIILEIIGTLLIINPFNTKMSLLGVLFTILAAITFAAYGVFGKKKCSEVGGIVVTCFGFIFGSLEMLLLVLLGKIDFVANIFSFLGLKLFSHVPLLSGYSLNNLPAVIYIFVFTTGLGYTCYFKAMEKTSANTASLIFFFKPILAPLLALIIIHEVIPVNMIIGIVFILLGSILSILMPIRATKKLLAKTSTSTSTSSIYETTDKL